MCMGAAYVYSTVTSEDTENRCASRELEEKEWKLSQSYANVHEF